MSNFAWAASATTYSVSLTRFLAEDELKIARATLKQFVGSGWSEHISNSSTEQLPRSGGDDETTLLTGGEGTVKTVSPRAGFEIVLEHPVLLLDEAAEVVTITRFGNSSAVYGFPDGLGVFVDPVTARYEETYVDAGIGMHIDTDVPSMLKGFVAGASLFARYSQQSLAVESALLNIRYSSQTVVPGYGYSLGWRISFECQTSLEVNLTNTYVVDQGRRYGLQGKLQWY
jgi:hypothetical protein